MRLVDADALLKRKGCVYDSEGHVLFAVGTGDIVHAPTIDAIPVEWLEKRRQNLILAAMVHSTVYGDNSVELCHAVNVVLDMWQKEQEKQGIEPKEG